MIDRINALGQFLVNKTGKTFNFKQIKNDHMYPGILFSFSGEDYLVTPDKAELDLTIALMSSRTFEDYPPKHARKDTPRKFEKINKKIQENIIYKGKKYVIIKLYLSFII